MEEDPIQDEQLAAVHALLGRPLTATEYEGFLIVSNRFVDSRGHSRLANLARIFDTDRAEGKTALAASLSQVAVTFGSYERFATEYPVTIIPARPAFPLFPIVSIEHIRPEVYRVLDAAHPAITYIRKNRRLPLRPKPSEPVLRKTPQGHWCAYEKWSTPDETRKMLQILPTWSNCEIRATIDTNCINGLCFVAYSVDPNDVWTKGLDFHGYFFEGVTQDHDELSYAGGAVQICVYGEPEVSCFESWDPDEKVWKRQF